MVLPRPSSPENMRRKNRDDMDDLHDVPRHHQDGRVCFYGVVLLELVSGRKAAGYNGELLLADTEERVFRGREERLEARAAAWMDPVLAEQSCPPGSVAAVMSVARACLQRDPAKRPSMVDVAYTVSRADEYFTDYSGESVSVDGSGEIAAR
ncbi:hypothetical protein ACQ4PT_071873 [Festuca glaucescens]